MSALARIGELFIKHMAFRMANFCRTQEWMKKETGVYLLRLLVILRTLSGNRAVGPNSQVLAPPSLAWQRLTKNVNSRPKSLDTDWCFIERGLTARHSYLRGRLGVEWRPRRRNEMYLTIAMGRDLRVCQIRCTSHRRSTCENPKVELLLQHWSPDFCVAK